MWKISKFLKFLAKFKLQLSSRNSCNKTTHGDLYTKTHCRTDRYSIMNPIRDNIGKKNYQVKLGDVRNNSRGMTHSS